MTFQGGVSLVMRISPNFRSHVLSGSQKLRTLTLISALLPMFCMFAVTAARASEMSRWEMAGSVAPLAAEPLQDGRGGDGDFRQERAPLRATLAALSFPDAGDSAETSRRAVPDVFGAVSIPISHLAIERRWQAIAPFHPAALFGVKCTKDRALCDTPLMHAWSRLRANLATGAASRREVLSRVNTEVNAAVRYRTDTDNYGVPDYWASPEEMARRGSGDCKELAIAKMWMLAALDVPASSMRIVVLKDTRRGLGHAVVSVDVDGTNLILDNVTSEIRSDRAVTWYQPLYSVNTTGSWIHGMRRPTRIASARTGSALDDAFAMHGAYTN